MISPALAEASTIDKALRVARFVGLIGFLGGAASLASFTWLGPEPQNAEQWHMLIHAMRAMFYPTMFGGIVILIIVGGTMWWRRRKSLNPQRWFRLMMVLVAIFVPTLHLLARSSMLAMDKSVNEGDLASAAQMWDRLAWAYLVAVVVFTFVSAIGIIKPRLGASSDI
jgi:hypothetical protein